MSSGNSLKEIYAAGNIEQLKDPGSGGTITTNASPGYMGLRSAAAEARTLANPEVVGAILRLVMEVDGGDITVTAATAFNETGDTTFVFSDPGQFAVFESVKISATAFAWRLTSHYGLGNTSPTESASLDGLTASAADLNALDVQALTVGAGAGLTDGVGFLFKHCRIKLNDLFVTTVFIDLTGTSSSTTDLDIIGTGTNPAYLLKLAAAETGTTIDAILMECLEAPAGGVTDIDVYSATEATGKFDDAVTGLTETALLTSGGAWTNGRQLGATVCPTATEYIYLTGGAAGTAAAYTAGKFCIRIYGH